MSITVEISSLSDQDLPFQVTVPSTMNLTGLPVFAAATNYGCWPNASTVFYAAVWDDATTGSGHIAVGPGTNFSLPCGVYSIFVKIQAGSETPVLPAVGKVRVR